MENYWAQSKNQVISELETSETHGLSPAIARSRLVKHGPNEISTAVRVSTAKLLWRQFRSPFIAILVFAAGLSFWQHERTDAIIIIVVIVVNVLIGFIEEFRAEKAIAKIRQLLAPTARVIRGAEEQKVSAATVVPGDIIKLEAGDRVPADARVIHAQALRINQSSLTGESMPVHKRETILSPATILAERANCLYLSTMVISGQAIAVVTNTGNQTEVGLIAKEVATSKKPPSELSHKVQRFGHFIAIISVILAAVVLALGISREVDAAVLFRSTLALLVSIVPEGLAIALTVGLSVGLIRIFKQHAVIRQLQAAETIGSLTTLCIDKTGTLTEGEMMVEKIFVAGSEYSVQGRGFGLTGTFSLDEEKIDPAKDKLLRFVLELTALASSSTISRNDLKRDRAKELTDPTETALAVVAAKGGFYAFEEIKQYPEVLEAPFDQERRFSFAVHLMDGRQRYIIKGAAEEIIKRSQSRAVGPNKTQRIGRAAQAELINEAERLARSGYRVVALAYVDRPKAETPGTSHVNDLVFVAILALNDPIRPEAYKAVAAVKKAGIRLIMLTGDHVLTASHVASHVGLSEGSVIHADELKYRSIDEISVVARLSPTEKLRIVTELQKKGELVGMTGDGINDAPALKKADVGIAMGRRGTDIAIEAADMVVLNDDLVTIMNAVKQGRLIWANLRKAVFYLTSTSLGEVLLLVLTILLGLPLPLIAIQILWLNLVTDGVTSLSLAFEGAEESLANQKPRDPKTPLVDSHMAFRMIFLSVVMSLGALFIFKRLLPLGIEVAQAGVLTTLAFYQLLNLFNARSESRSIFVLPFFNNKVLLGTLSLAIMLQLMALYIGPLATVLHLEPLPPNELLICIAVGSSVIVLEELRKFGRRMLIQWARLQEDFA